MKLYCLSLLWVILLAGCSAQTAGSFMGGMVGAVADGIVGGITGADPETQKYFYQCLFRYGRPICYAK